MKLLSQAGIHTHGMQGTVTDVRALISPSFAALIFVCLPLIVLLRPDTMLTDPGVGWHLKTGEYILATGTIPHTDLFSFTLPNAPWTAYEWLFQVLAAALTRLGGLPLLTAVSALLYASVPVLLYQSMVRDHSNVAVAALLSLMSSVLLIAHAHARPHIVTYLIFFLLSDRLGRFIRGEAEARSLVVFVPLTTLWANLHGGFLLGPVLAGLYCLGAAVKWLVSRSALHVRQLRVCAALGLAMSAASLINPAGWALHASIIRYLRSASIALMAEYQSPNFRSGTASILLFELLILGVLVVVALRPTSLDLTECILLAFFLHESLVAVRHIPLFTLIAVPILGRQLTLLLESKYPEGIPTFDGMAARQRSLQSNPLYFALVSVVLVTLSLTAPTLFRHDLDDIYLSRGAAQFIAADKDSFGRMFNTSALGGALVYRFWPDLKIFGDDRNDFYGDAFMIGRYFPILSAQSNWQEILDGYGVTSAIVLRGEVAAELFRTSADWTIAYQDGMDEIFMRAR